MLFCPFPEATPIKPLTPEIAERLARLNKFCEEMGSEAQFDLLELGHRYTAGEITFDEFQRAYWQTRPVGERLEETWRLSEEAYSKSKNNADGKGFR